MTFEKFSLTTVQKYKKSGKCNRNSVKSTTAQSKIVNIQVTAFTYYV